MDNLFEMTRHGRYNENICGDSRTRAVFCIGMHFMGNRKHEALCGRNAWKWLWAVGSHACLPLVTNSGGATTPDVEHDGSAPKGAFDDTIPCWWRLVCETYFGQRVDKCGSQKEGHPDENFWNTGPRPSPLKWSLASVHRFQVFFQTHVNLPRVHCNLEA